MLASLQGLLPFRDLRGVDLVAFGNLVDRLLLAQYLQGDFALELGGERTSLFHRLPLLHFTLLRQAVQFYPARSILPKNFHPLRSDAVFDRDILLPQIGLLRKGRTGFNNVELYKATAYSPLPTR